MRVQHTDVMPPLWINTIITILMVWMAGGATGASLLFAGERNTSKNSTQVASEVQWFQCTEETFQHAEAEDKLILLDLTAVWCHACHVMDEMTYAQSKIIMLLNTQFVPVRVDTDQRPDIEARYRYGGWPTTSILLPTGEILFQANSLGPEELHEALTESDRLYRDHKVDLVNRAAEVWATVEAAKNKRVRPNGAIDEDVLEQAVLLMGQSFDGVNGGFRDAPKFFEPEAITLAFRLYHQKSDETFKRMALLTLDKQQRLLDPVWGGFYRYAVNPDWTHPHYEKMLPVQALNLENYLEAYQVTGNPQYRKVVEGIIQYVTRFLLDEKQGGFYASQDADLRNQDASSQHVLAGEDYFRLGEAQRLSLGIPNVDRTVYTGWNGLMIVSYLKAYQILGDDELREFALKTLNRLYEERFRQGMGMAHAFINGHPQRFGLLTDQVFFAKAFVEAAIATGDQVYLQKAEQLANHVVEQLEDQQGGGFYDRPSRAAEPGLLKFPQKPLKENVQVALLFCDLFYLTEKRDYRDIAEWTLQYVLGSSEAFPVALTAIAVDRFLRHPVHVVIVGSRSTQQTRRLFREGLRLYAPGKIVRLLDPQVDSLRIGEVTFPNIETPRAYICTDKLCSQPIDKPEVLKDGLTELLVAMSSGVRGR